MANPEHRKILDEGVEAWNKWRMENPSIVPDLNGENLIGAGLTEANFSGADLTKANLSRVILWEANLSRAILIEADLSKASLSGVDLSGADLRRANLAGACLVTTNLSEGNLQGASLAGAILAEVDLSGANFVEADLSGADLSGVDFSGANFNGTKLIGAFLIGARIVNASMSDTNLDGANLTRADLRGTQFWLTTFRSANLEETNFTDSMMFDATFADVDLSQAKGLETVKHQGPSMLGIDSIQLSRGKIPEAFLRGTGASDELIAFVRAMSGAIQFYSCFISYSSKDHLFAERLYADLQAKGVRCWFAPHDVQGGKKLHEQIEHAIQIHERLLLILSPESIHSEWVETEIAKARKREALEKRRVLFPVLLKISYKELKEWECFDADTGKDSAREIREYYIPDFSHWESPEKFNEEFEKLVRDLKKTEAAGN